jgi:hypothetical protein
MNGRKTVLILLLLSLLLAAPGCRKKPDREPAGDKIAEIEEIYAQEPAAESPEQDSPGLEKALDLWKTGRQEKAANVFLVIDWNQPPSFSPDSVFSLSEKQFASLPTAKRFELQRQAMDVTDTMRDLVKDVISLGRDSLAQKDYDEARNCFEAIRNCGKTLSSSDSLTVIKMTGDAMQKLAARELTTLRERTAPQ